MSADSQLCTEYHTCFHLALRSPTHSVHRKLSTSTNRAFKVIFTVVLEICSQTDRQTDKHGHHNTSPPLPGARRSIVMTVCVYLSVSLSVCEPIFKNTRPIFTKNFTHVTYVRCSFLCWQRCNMLCTSGFIDDVIFAHNEPYAGVSV